jgi:LEA14-like dessication related protein
LHVLTLPMNMKNIFLLLLLACAICFQSCRNIREVQPTGIKGFTLDKVSMEGLEGNILLGLKNPNNFAFTIYKSEFDVRYSGVYLGKAKLAKKVRIKANAEETYSFKLKSDLKNTNVMDVMKLLNGSSFKNNLEIKGDLRVGKFLMYKSFPVDVSEKLQLK